MKILAIASLLWLCSCTHTIQVEPSDKPFVVNLNVKIDHEIRHRVENDNQDLINLEKETVKHKSGGKK